MFDQLDIVEERYEQLNEMLSDPEIVNDPDKLRKYSKEQADLQKTVDVYRDYKEVSSEMQTICFPVLPPVIMDWNAAGKTEKKP